MKVVTEAEVRSPTPKPQDDHEVPMTQQDGDPSKRGHVVSLLTELSSFMKSPTFPNPTWFQSLSEPSGRM